MKCQRCGVEGELYRQYNSNGAVVVVERCPHCRQNTRPGMAFINKGKVVGYENLPIFEDYRPESEPCAVCGEQHGSEYNHWAPRYIFGSEAEKWPGDYLCPKHHKEWHDKVTPEMTKGKKK